MLSLSRSYCQFNSTFWFFKRPCVRHNEILLSSWNWCLANVFPNHFLVIPLKHLVWHRNSPSVVKRTLIGKCHRFSHISPRIPLIFCVPFIFFQIVNIKFVRDQEHKFSHFCTWGIGFCLGVTLFLLFRVCAQVEKPSVGNHGVVLSFATHDQKLNFELVVL